MIIVSIRNTDNYNKDLTHHCPQLVSIRNLLHIEQEVKTFVERHAINDKLDKLDGENIKKSFDFTERILKRTGNLI